MFEELFEELNLGVDNTLQALASDLSRINTGRNQSAILELLKVDYYGTMTALNHVSVISDVSYSEVTIEPYQKNSLQAIDKVIRDNELQLNSQIRGNIIHVFFPQMTVDRRNKLIKMAKAHGEKAKVAIREHRRFALKTVEDYGAGENDSDFVSKQIESFIVKAVNRVEELTKDKVRNLTLLK